MYDISVYQSYQDARRRRSKASRAYIYGIQTIFNERCTPQAGYRVSRACPTHASLRIFLLCGVKGGWEDANSEDWN